MKITVPDIFFISGIVLLTIGISNKYDFWTAISIDGVLFLGLAIFSQVTKLKRVP